MAQLVSSRPRSGCAKAVRPADGLALVAVERGRIVGTIRLWHVTAGPGRAALLLGPLAVHPDCRNRGIGTTLMRRAIARARLAGHGAVLLVGDASYYGRFGFSASRPATSGCRAASSATGSSGWNSSRRRSPEPAA